MPELALAFQHGHTFVADDARYKVKVIALPKLAVPSGKLFAADPFTLRKIVPFERTVKRGTYPVFASIATIKYAAKKAGRDQERLGAAMVRLKAGAVARWVNATKRGQKLATLEDGQVFGYGVDAGTGCFADVTAAEALAQLDEVELANERWDGYLLGKVADLLGAPSWGASWITVPKTKANIVVFPSGWGDGVYASYWGLSKTGAVLCLATDFGVYP